MKPGLDFMDEVFDGVYDIFNYFGDGDDTKIQSLVQIDRNNPNRAEIFNTVGEKVQKLLDNPELMQRFGLGTPADLHEPESG